MTEPPRTAIDPGEWIAAQDLDDDEARAAALAIVRHRDEARDVEQLRNLDPIGAEVATRAYRRGVEDVLDAIDDLIGVASTSIDPRVLVVELRRRLPLPLDFGPGYRDPLRGPGADTTAAAIVSAAVSTAEALAAAASIEKREPTR